MSHSCRQALYCGVAAFLLAMNGEKRVPEPAVGPIKKDRKPAPDTAARAGAAASDFLKSFSGTSFDVLVRQAGTSRPDLA